MVEAQDYLDMRGEEILTDLLHGRRDAKEKLRRQHAVVVLDSSSSELADESEEDRDLSSEVSQDEAVRPPPSVLEENQPAMEGLPSLIDSRSYGRRSRCESVGEKTRFCTDRRGCLDTICREEDCW